MPGKQEAGGVFAAETGVVKGSVGRGPPAMAAPFDFDLSELHRMFQISPAASRRPGPPPVEHRKGLAAVFIGVDSSDLSD